MRVVCVDRRTPTKCDALRDLVPFAQFKSYQQRY